MNNQRKSSRGLFALYEKASFSRSQTPRKKLFQKLFYIISCYLAKSFILLWAPLRHDVFIFGFGTSLLRKNIDFFVRSFHSKFNIIAYGGASETQVGRDLVKFCREKNISLLENGFEIPNQAPTHVFMCSYPKLIPEDLLEKVHFLNMHGALLPSYRGIHGGTWAIINGERYHGYTIHKVDKGIDSGPVYYQGRIETSINEDVNSIRDRIYKHFAENSYEVFERIFSGKLIPVPQEEESAKYVCKRYPQDGKICWKETAWNVHNLIRALAPPYTEGAFTYYKEKPLFITKSYFSQSPSYISIPGQVVAT